MRSDSALLKSGRKIKMRKKKESVDTVNMNMTEASLKNLGKD